MKTFKEFLLIEGINENNYRNWGFVSKNGRVKGVIDKRGVTSLYYVNIQRRTNIE